MDMHSLQASLTRLSSMYVPMRRPMRHPARKLLTRTRQEPSSPVMVPQSRLTRNSFLRSLASCARNLGARILRMLPKIAASMRKTEQQKLISTPPRRQVRNPIQQSSRSPNWARNWTSWRRLLRRLPTSLRNAVGTIATLVANRKLGRVALEK